MIKSMLLTLKAHPLVAIFSFVIYFVIMYSIDDNHNILRSLLTTGTWGVIVLFLYRTREDSLIMKLENINNTDENKRIKFTGDYKKSLKAYEESKINLSKVKDELAGLRLVSYWRNLSFLGLSLLSTIGAIGLIILFSKNPNWFPSTADDGITQVGWIFIIGVLLVCSIISVISFLICFLLSCNKKWYVSFWIKGYNEYLAYNSAITNLYVAQQFGTHQSISLKTYRKLYNKNLTLFDEKIINDDLVNIKLDKDANYSLIKLPNNIIKLP